jgi:hypothetical protein
MTIASFNRRVGKGTQKVEKCVKGKKERKKKRCD